MTAEEVNHKLPRELSAIVSEYAVETPMDRAIIAAREKVHERKLERKKKISDLSNARNELTLLFREIEPLSEDDRNNILRMVIKGNETRLEMWKTMKNEYVSVRDDCCCCCCMKRDPPPVELIVAYETWQTSPW